MLNTVHDKSKERMDTKIEKKPYEKPAIVYHAPLEAAAGACPPPAQGGTGKNASGQPGCSTVFS